VIALCNQYRFVIHFITAAWMAVMSGGVSITHCHAGGDERHTHNSPRSAAPIPGSRSPEIPTEPHRHLVLFGVQFPSESAPDSGPLGPGDTLTVQGIRWDCNEVQTDEFVLEVGAILTERPLIIDLPVSSGSIPHRTPVLPAVPCRRSDVLRL